ncbi:MAG: PEP-CTERM sorting domain-containing protein [Planctomycetales bacterium]
MKIGIQSPDYGSLPAGSTRTGDNNWDFLLVQLPVQTPNVWSTESIDFDTGLWYVVQRGGAGGGTFSTPVPSGTGQTLEGIYGGAGFGGNADLAALFTAGSTIVSLEFGLGTGQGNASNFIGSLQTSIYNGGDPVFFATAPAPVPEPTSLALWAVGGLGMAFAARRRRTRGGKA